jgi:C-terminal processing protease CtpA/Prc
MSKPIQFAKRMAVAFVLLLAFAQPSHATEQRLGFAVRMEGEGFFLNPLVKTLVVSEVIKGSLAEAAGMKVGDQILQIEGQNVAGRRALELRPYMKLNPGETRTLRLKHADGTQADVRITKPAA